MGHEEGRTSARLADPNDPVYFASDPPFGCEILFFAFKAPPPLGAKKSRIWGSSNRAEEPPAGNRMKARAEEP